MSADSAHSVEIKSLALKSSVEMESEPLEVSDVTDEEAGDFVLEKDIVNLEIQNCLLTEMVEDLEKVEDRNTALESKVVRQQRVISRLKRENKVAGVLRCGLCRESWGVAWNHQLCSLPCGHFMGYNCIRKHFREVGTFCPTCNRRCSEDEFRIHSVFIAPPKI